MHFRSKFPQFRAKKSNLENAFKYLDLFNIAVNRILAALKRYSDLIPEVFMCDQSTVNHHASLPRNHSARQHPEQTPHLSKVDLTKWARKCVCAAVDLCDRVKLCAHRLSCGKRDRFALGSELREKVRTAESKL